MIVTKFSAFLSLYLKYRVLRFRNSRNSHFFDLRIFEYELYRLLIKSVNRLANLFRNF